MICKQVAVLKKDYQDREGDVIRGCFSGLIPLNIWDATPLLYVGRIAGKHRSEQNIKSHSVREIQSLQ